MYYFYILLLNIVCYIIYFIKHYFALLLCNIIVYNYFILFYCYLILIPIKKSFKCSNTPNN